VSRAGLGASFTVDFAGEVVKSVARSVCVWAVARGNVAIRSQVYVSRPELVAVRALLELRVEFSPYLDLQLVAFP